MNIRRFLIPFAVAGACTGALFSEPPDGAQARVELVRVRTNIVVRQRIVAGAEALVVPTCGTAENQTLALCNLAVDIEVESLRGWGRAQLSYIGSIPGGYPIEQGPVTVIQPGTVADFTFTIDKQDWVLVRGENVRLRIHTWPTEEAMRARGPKRDVVTAPFKVL